jgi:hypothetical protein
MHIRRHCSLPLLTAPLLLATACSAEAAPRDSPPQLDAGAPAGDAGSELAADAAPPALDAAPPTGPEPFAIEVWPTAVRMRAGESFELRVTVARRPELTRPVVLETFGLPRGVAAARVFATAEESEVRVVLVASPDAATEGEVAFALQASAEGWRRSLRLTISVRP